MGTWQTDHSDAQADQSHLLQTSSHILLLNSYINAYAVQVFALLLRGQASGLLEGESFSDFREKFLLIFHLCLFILYTLYMYLDFFS